MNAFAGLPHGKYSTRHRIDGEEKILISLKDAATEEN